MSIKKRSHERDPCSLSQARESVSLQKSCYAAGSITSQYFLDFLNLSESWWEKAVFVQRHNTSLHSKFRQTALKLTPKGLDYTQIDTLREPCIIDLWFWEVLGQSQSWLRTTQTALWKLYINSHIFEFLTSSPKIKLLRMRKNVIALGKDCKDRARASVSLLTFYSSKQTFTRWFSFSIFRHSVRFSSLRYTLWDWLQFICF